MSQPGWLSRTVLALLAASTSIFAAEDIIVNQFNSDSEITQWVRFWGTSPTFSFDATMDADGNASSGALRVDLTFDSSSGDNQFSIRRDLTLFDGSQYSNLVMDIYWDVSSPTSGANNWGYLEPGLTRENYGQIWLTPGNVTTAGTWFRLTLPIDGTAVGIESIRGPVLKMWGGSALNGPARFWVDNVKFIARTVTSNPPPSMAISRAKPGLKMAASAAGSQYQRQSIRTVSPEYSWVGAFDPVTYSVTIKDYPGTNYGGFQTHVFIVPGSTIPASETTPDWNQPHIVFFHIGNNAEGGANATFRYKVNQPNGNGMIWGEGALASVLAPSPLGTWNLTFNPGGGGITMTAPNGTSTNFFLPAEHEALFTGPAYAYIGVQPNEVRNIGQSATIAQVQITGVINPLDDTFTSGQLDTSKWELAAESPVGIVSVPETALGWLSWTLPDRGFILESSTDLAGTNWAAATVTAVQLGSEKQALIEGTEEARFFRLKKVD